MTRRIGVLERKMCPHVADLSKAQLVPDADCTCSSVEVVLDEVWLANGRTELFRVPTGGSLGRVDGLMLHGTIVSSPEPVRNTFAATWRSTRLWRGVRQT